MWFSATKSVGEILFSPENYRAISGSNFTPLLGLSFKVDWLFFGMEPYGYNIHNLLAVLMAGAALFLFMKLYTTNPGAFTGVILFLLNPVVLSVYSWSSTRHYMEGMFFALISLYLFVRADRVDKGSILSGCFYLLSALFKEVYVLLPIVMIFISGGSIFQRIKKTIPVWTGLFIYSAWRFWMLGGIGGYPFGNSLGLKSLTAGIYRIIESMPFHLFGYYHILFWVVFFTVIATVRKKTKILVPGVIFLILLVPVLPVSSLFDLHHSWARYVFHLTVFLIIISILWGRETFEQGGWRSAAVISVLIWASLIFFIRDNELKKILKVESEHARETMEEFLFSKKEFITARQPVWFYDGLRDINEYFFDIKVNTKIIPDDRWIDYAAEDRRLEITSQGYDIKKPDIAKGLKRDVIKGKIIIEGYRIKWEFGPYKTGKYFIIRGRYKGLYNYISPVRRDGEYLFGKYYPDDRPEVFYLRVIYRSPEGWEGISKEYLIEIPGNSMEELKQEYTREQI